MSPRMQIDDAAARRWTFLLLPFALAFVVAEILWTQILSFDEIEFFRATRWVSEGRLPFRDFWEHHLPLQWLLFAPVAALLGDTPSVGQVQAMRWAQLPLWVAVCAILLFLLRRAGIDRTQRWMAVLLLAVSWSFVETAVEYRPDALGCLAYIGALAVALIRPRKAAPWIAFGALMSAAVLANMRMAPLAIVTAAVIAFVDTAERRWRFNLHALWMCVSVAMVAGAFLVYLYATGSMAGFARGMEFNVLTDSIVSEEAHTFWPTLLIPFREGDVGTIVLWVAAVIATIRDMRDIRRPGLLQLFAMLAIAAVALVALQGIHYAYHFQTVYLLMAPLAASVLALPKVRAGSFALIAAAVFANLGFRADPAIHRIMKQQDVILREVHRRTQPHEKVWDGCGFAFNRPPAYKYWFLPAGVRLLAARGYIEPYDALQMAADPPAAIIYNERVFYWLQRFPDAARYATSHYVPLHRNLWLPGLSVLVEPRVPVARWIAPHDGRYRLYASDVLAKHPWFMNPLRYGIYAGPSAPLFEVPLPSLPRIDRRDLLLIVNGVPVEGDVVELRRGARVELRSRSRQRIGVLIVPESWRVAFITPEERFS